jgi:RHS repeat-associated protein
VLWAASYTAWADLDLLHAAAIDNPIRLQGQYADPETGLYYNRHRYFCPHAGQFISQDPIQLQGGDHLYAFAADTLGWIDPLGLKCKQPTFKQWLKKKAAKGKDTHVYVAKRNGKVVYVGIAKDIEARAPQHGDRFDELVPLTTKPLNRGEARAIEQAIIHNNPKFENAINSISDQRALYNDAVKHGEKWLVDNGLGNLVGK